MKRAPARILVIDDDSEDARLVDRALLDHGYISLLATNGEDALRIATMLQPDLVLLDIRMPRMDGYEVAAMLRMQRGLERTQIVAVTGMADDRERIEAAGFDGYIQKPILRESFFGQIEGFLLKRFDVQDAPAGEP
jgi:CheY-like chemotaxis protein